MGNVIDEYCERLSRLVEYARSGKNPSIWWNGVEYKWDKKHGKYLHWSTLPNGEKRADEPPYEAMNPLFAAAGVPETNDKKNAPKIEPKEEKKPEPIVEPEKEERQEESIVEIEPLDSVVDKLYDPELSLEYRKEIVAKWADSPFFNSSDDKFNQECVGFLKSDDVPLYGKCAFIKGVRDFFEWKELKGSAFTLKDCEKDKSGFLTAKRYRGLFMEELEHAKETFNKDWDEIGVIEYSPSQVRPHFTWFSGRDNRFWGFSPWGTVSKFGSHDRQSRNKTIDELRKHSYPNVPSARKNVDELKKRNEFVSQICDVAAYPTTTDYEAFMLLASVGCAQECFASHYVDGNCSFQVFKKAFDQHAPRGTLDEIVSRAVKAGFGSDSTSAEKPAPPMTVNHPIGREKEKAQEEEDDYDHDKYTSLNDEIYQRIMEFAEDKSTPDSLAKEGVLCYFPTEPESVAAMINGMDDDVESAKRWIPINRDNYPVYLKRIQTPDGLAEEFQHFKETQEALLEYLDDWKRREPRLNKAIKEWEDYIHNELSEGPNVVQKYKEAYDAKVLPLIKQEETLTPEPETTPQEENNPKEEEESESVPRYDQLATIVDSRDLNLDEKNRIVAKWAESFFPDSAKYGEHNRRFFTSDEIPFYAKKFILKRLSYYASNRLSIIKNKEIPEFKTMQELSDFIDENGVLTNTNVDITRDIDRTEKKLSETWEQKIAVENHYSVSDYWGKRYAFYTDLSVAKRKKFQTRESAIKNARSLVSIPGVLTKEDKQAVLDRISYVAAVANLPTTSDEEAMMLLTKLYECGKNQKNIRFAKEFIKEYQWQDFQEKLDEIAGRSDSAPKKPETVGVDELKRQRSSGERREVDPSIPISETTEDFNSFLEQVRAEEMTPEEAERDRKETEELVDVFNKLATDDYKTEDEKARDEYNSIEKSVINRAENLDSFKAYKRGLGYDDDQWIRSSEVFEILRSLNGTGTSKVSGIDPGPEKDEIRRLLEKIDGAQSDLKKRRSDLSKQNVYRTNVLEIREGVPYDHEKTLKILKRAFPDRGGSVFFPSEWRSETLQVMSHRDQKLAKIAEEIFDVYDIIGKCFNVGGKTFEPPIVEFAKISKDALGEYRDTGNRLLLSSSAYWESADGERIRRTFAHELGHWIEHLQGRSLFKKNEAWLKENAGSSNFDKDSQWENQQKKTPHLTVRPSGYGLRTYHDRAGNMISTELISTGMEFLVFSAAMFAIRSPKHFNLLLDNFKEFSK